MRVREEAAVMKQTQLEMGAESSSKDEWDGRKGGALGLCERVLPGLALSSLSSPFQSPPHCLG